MAAARIKVALPIFRIRNSLLTAESCGGILRVSIAQNHNSFSTSSDSSLLQTLLKAPISKIKATLDSEFGSESTGFPWAALLTSLNSSAPEKANLVIEWKLEKLAEERNKNHDSYAQLISLCEKIRNLPIALLIFTSMEAQGIKPTSMVFNALIATSLSSGNLLTAFSLFEIMERSEGCSPDLDTYNAFISAYANLGNMTATDAWVKAKGASGFSINDVQTYGFLIRCCIRAKQTEDGQRYFDEMMSYGLRPDESIFQDMLWMYCQKRNYTRVRDILKFLLNNQWQIDPKTAKKIVYLYSEQGQMDELEELLVILSESNQTSEVLSIVHCSIIRIYADRDRLDDAEYSVGRMLKEGISFSCSEDVEKVICSYFRKEAYDRLDLFLERIKDSYKLSSSIYDLLSAGYRRAGLLEKFDMVVNEMKLAGLA